METLTKREIEVLQARANNRTYEDIARELFITRGTVKGHFQKICKKLEINSSHQAVAEGFRRGLIE